MVKIKVSGTRGQVILAPPDSKYLQSPDSMCGRRMYEVLAYDPKQIGKPLQEVYLPGHAIELWTE